MEEFSSYEEMSQQQEEMGRELHYSAIAALQRAHAGVGTEDDFRLLAFVSGIDFDKEVLGKWA